MGRILKNSILGHVRHVLPCALARASRAPLSTGTGACGRAAPEHWHVARALCRPAPHRALAVTWLPPPALRRSRPPQPWSYRPPAAGSGCWRVILACAGGSRARTVQIHLARVRVAACRIQTLNRAHEPNPTRTRPTARSGRVCSGTEDRFKVDLGRTYRTRRPSGRPSRGCPAHAPCGGAPTTRAGARWAQFDIATATRSRAAPRSRVFARTLAYSCGAGCGVVWAYGGGHARPVDAFDLR